MYTNSSSKVFTEAFMLIDLLWFDHQWLVWPSAFFFQSKTLRKKSISEHIFCAPACHKLGTLVSTWKDHDRNIKVQMLGRTEFSSNFNKHVFLLSDLDKMLCRREKWEWLANQTGWRTLKCPKILLLKLYSMSFWTLSTGERGTLDLWVRWTALNIFAMP